MHTVSPGTLYFSGFTLDLLRCALRRGDEEIPLRSKSFDALRYLAENPGRLITKDEFIKAVWPDVFVTDDSLVQCIMDIRQALSDDEHRIVKTIPRRGYIFATEVSTTNPSLPAPSAAADEGAIPGEPVRSILVARWPRRALALAAGLGILVVAAGGWILWDMTRIRATGPATAPAQSPRPAVAVLPFTNLSGDPRQDYFSNGVTEDIINSLSRFSGLVVIARSSSFSFKGKAVTAREAAQQLGVRYILEGGIQKSGEQVRVTAQLVDAEAGANRWADRFDRPLTGIFAVQDEITQRIVATLIAHISKAELQRASQKSTLDFGAYDYYLRGRELRLSYKRDGTEEAIRLLEKAISLDPKFTPALVELGHAHRSRFNFKWGNDPAQDLNRAAELAQRAVALDASSSSAHALLGAVYALQGRFDEALTANEKAIVLNPNDAYSYSLLAVALTRAGRPRDAVEIMRMAIRLDPFYPPAYSFYLGRAHYLAREYDKAVPALRQCTERTPDWWPCRLFLAVSFAQLDRVAESRSEVTELQRLRPGFSIKTFQRELAPAYQNPNDVEHLLEGLRKAGLPDSQS